MTIQLRFFAALRERLKMSEATRTVPPGTTAAALWAALCHEHPVLEPLSASVSFAVNREYVERDHVLRDGDELALIPPVSGGCGAVAGCQSSVVGRTAARNRQLTTDIARRPER